MGDPFDEGYPADGERPVHEVTLSPYLLDETAVTNAQFATFVKATGHVTEAEEIGISAVFHLAVEASRADVLGAPTAPRGGWSCAGADWRHPAGPLSGIGELAPAPGRPRHLARRPGLLPGGPASGCRPRPSGSTPPAAGSPAPASPGATS